MSAGPVDAMGGAVEPVPDGPRRSVGALAARILVVQAATLILLWLLQVAFGG